MSGFVGATLNNWCLRALGLVTVAWETGVRCCFCIVIWQLVPWLVIGVFWVDYILLMIDSGMLLFATIIWEPWTPPTNPGWLSFGGRLLRLDIESLPVLSNYAGLKLVPDAAATSRRPLIGLLFLRLSAFLRLEFWVLGNYLSCMKPGFEIVEPWTSWPCIAWFYKRVFPEGGL